MFTDRQAEDILDSLTKDLNTIRWGAVPLTLEVLATLLEHSETGSKRFVWVIGSEVAASMDMTKPSAVAKELINYFDGYSRVPYSIGVMYGAEVLAGRSVPKDYIILAVLEDNVVTSHVASRIKAEGAL